MKNVKLQIAVAILLAALAGSLGAIAAERWFTPAQPGGLHEFVHEQLELTAEQENQIDQLEERHAIENAQREFAVRRANADLAAAMNSEHEYGPEVSAAIDKVHASMGELQKASVRHVFAMRRILDEEQQRQFDRQVARALTGSPPE
ncbi:heavy metal resistance protein [Erythrobacter sp. QSSC1-22B]|uniref:Spy/CpxP family protein refolding chaperone n=1 Tax=Erythrobacter sp. QSSC1-22B TaxID=1860125 RepID=UPI0008050FB7|nr:periplasmic heavy metal sensor [Erythrobacter sp. QSSC1-22B]OBX18949.1 heavy metal resistance protein [Erythrobacter sp. QSSC1-22B]